MIIVVGSGNTSFEAIQKHFPLYDVRHLKSADDITALTAGAVLPLAAVVNLDSQDDWVNYDFLRTCFSQVPQFAIIGSSDFLRDSYNWFERATEYGAEGIFSDPVNYEVVAQAIRKTAPKKNSAAVFDGAVCSVSSEHLELSIQINNQISRLQKEASEVLTTVGESFRNPNASGIKTLRERLRHLESMSFLTS
jgi:DNA-binding NarL/FixJ family response regulator